MHLENPVRLNTGMQLINRNANCIYARGPGVVLQIKQKLLKKRKVKDTSL